MSKKERSVLKQVGANIRAYRKGAKITQNDLAAKIKVGQSTISKMEGGVHDISAIHWHRLEAVLGISWANSSYLLLEPVLAV